MMCDDSFTLYEIVQICITKLNLKSERCITKACVYSMYSKYDAINHES